MGLKIGFIGAGNMGGALACAAAKGGYDVLISDKDDDKAKQLADKISATVSDNLTVAAKCDYIFFGVKPQFMSDMICEIRDTLTERKDKFVIVSMAAGVSTETIENELKAKLPVIRIMPNMAAAVGQGTILCAKGTAVTNSKVTTLSEILCKAGIFDVIPESLIDAGCALSGSGPAYVYMFIEAMADGGVKCGLPRDKAILYAANTVLGAARTVLETGSHPAALKDGVCSPAGTTVAGVAALEERAFRGAVIDAVVAGFNRAVEIGKKK